MSKKYEIALFDFDGTLFDTGMGIKNGLRTTFQQYGIPVPPESTLNRFIGPPMWDSLQEYCRIEWEQADRMVKTFREHYQKENWLQLELYDGTRELLRDLKASGIKISTATSKPQKTARRILQHYEMESYFVDVVGANEDGSRSLKKELIPYAIEKCGGAPLDRVVMIGDTHFDGDGAKETGVDFVGVTYGYGTEQELIKAGAAKLAANTDELRRYLLL